MDHITCSDIIIHVQCHVYEIGGSFYPQNEHIKCVFIHSSLCPIVQRFQVTTIACVHAQKFEILVWICAGKHSRLSGNSARVWNGT